MVDVRSDPSEVRFRRTVMWVNVSVAVFTQVFVSALLFGWMNLRSSLEVLLCATSCLLAVAGALAAVRLRRAFLRVSHPSS
jgi:protein-S-isoprenylcysteine O-methyltransferase Ste14